MKAFLIALQFLSRIHLASQSVWRDEDFGRSVLFFPFVGLIIGLLLAALYWASSFLFDAFGRSALVVAFWFYLTGGLHADGYMDTAFPAAAASGCWKSSRTAASAPAA